MSYFWKGYFSGVLIAITLGLSILYQINRITEQDYRQLKLVDLDGKEVDLSRFNNKRLVINYWATWCKPCIEEFPDFDKARIEFGDSIAFIMISDDTAMKVRKLLKNKHLGLIFYISTSRLPIDIRPVTYFYNLDKNDFHKKIGAIDSITLRENCNKF